jgi:hypothetical protein
MQCTQSGLYKYDKKRQWDTVHVIKNDHLEKHFYLKYEHDRIYVMLNICWELSMKAIWEYYNSCFSWMPACMISYIIGEFQS